MVVAPEIFGGGEGGRDPCPALRKYVEVAYKCKPTHFRSKVICQYQTLQLDCDQSSETNDHHQKQQEEQRLAINSAQFASASSADSHIYCPDNIEDMSYSSSSIPSSSDISFKAAHNNKAATHKCESSYATEAVMQKCHGQSKCTTHFLFLFNMT